LTLERNPRQSPHQRARAKVYRALLDAPADLNETGWRMSLAKLAALVEAG
jgi:hypothetical protein